ncbi:MAG: hypothetical protein JXN60_01305 [Lentisphaerae bacterium]|nr:hypothetical protein [Lentisphaerota bacterium]
MMIHLSNREIMLLVATATVILFGASFIAARPALKQLKELKIERSGMAAAIEYDKQLVQQQNMWTEKLEGLSKLLPHYPGDKNVGVYWLSKLNSLASKHGLMILKHQLGTVEKEGDIYELPIDCKEWEGELNAIVRFLFDLQNEGAMLDIQHLTMKPKGRNELRGRFVLNCAYTCDE